MFSNALQTQEQLKGQNEYYSVVAEGVMLDRVYSMRYKSYSADKYIEKNSSEKFFDEYDNVPNSINFLAYHGKKAIGSMRACVYDPSKSYDVPAMDIFDKEIEENFGYDQTFVEMNKFVIDPSFQRRGGMHARFMLMGAVLDESLNRGAKAILVACRSEHVKFYQILGGKAISAEKSYPHLNFKTVLMLCTELDWSKRFLQRKLRVAA